MIINSLKYLPFNKKTCFYCRRQLVNAPQTSPFFKTVDHVIPRSKGGGNTPLNLVDCCSQCNTLKGCRLPEDFSQLLITSIKYGKTKGGYSGDKLKFILASNNLLIDIIEPYRHKLYSTYRERKVRVEKTVKEAPVYKLPSHAEWLINYQSQPDPNFHTP